MLIKRRALGAAIASLALFTAACSGSPEEAAESVAGEASEAAGDAAGGASEAAEPTEDATESTGEPTVLIGTVGTEEDPDAFVIALTDESGELVTELPAGDYTIQVSDPSDIHNFHLLGGTVDETTSVPDKEDTTFDVTLEPGDYTYKCDPHPPMTGSFTVT